jgi:signal transduction histidine kinase/HAMP domain-containing protein
VPITGADLTKAGGRLTVAAGWLGPWLAVAALGLWTSSPDVGSLLLAALGVFAGAVLHPTGRGVARGIAVSILVAAIVTAFWGHRRVDSVLTDFDAYWTARDEVVGGLLGGDLDRRAVAGKAATDELIARWTESAELDSALVGDLRSRDGLSALALYDSFGRLLYWDGVHRGRVPESVQVGEAEYSYHDFPLFGYLYITSIAGDGSTAVAAFLLRSALPEGLRADVGDFASNFYRETNERIRIFEADPGPWDGVVYDLVLSRDRILSVVVDRPDPLVRAEQMTARWGAAVAVLALLAWTLLALGRPRRVANAVVAAATLVLLAGWLPLEDVGFLRVLFDPEAYRLAGPVHVSLGRFALLGVTAFALVSVLPRPRFSLPAWGTGLLVAATFPLLLGWAVAGSAPSALAESRLEWVVYQVAAAALVSLVAGGAIALSRPERRWTMAAPMAAGLALALGAGGAIWVWRSGGPPLWWAGLWGLPAALATLGARSWEGWRRSVVAWGLGIVVGGSAAVPVTWAHRVQARMAVGEARLSELAAFSLPSLEADLLRFAAVADSLDRAGNDDVSLLYAGWRQSGLSESGHPVQMQIHGRDGTPGEELRVGVAREAPPPLGAALQDAWREGGVRLLHLNRDDARYILTTALEDGDVVAVVAPPFIESSDRSGLGPLLRGISVDEVDPLTVIPLAPGEEHPSGGVEWIRTGSGWQGEMAVEFENATRYHAHYLVALPGAVLAVARATLLLVLDLVLFFSLWLVGQGLVNDIGRRDVRLSPFVISFRARVTLALFGFFALANALFGTVAYRTLNEASRRSARVIAERVAEDAAGWYRALGGRMQMLGSQVGAELLEYRDGELWEGSAEELVELGLYEGWTPPEVYQGLSRREVVSEFTETTLGRWEYVTAYRHLAEGDILAVQVPLEAGMSALRTSDLVELLLFLVLVGAGLSLGLAMLAGRALTRPIAALLVASERVGAGDLAMRLPEKRADEFGAVFQAFNRMVGRVRRARRQLVRTSKRTQLIMDEAAVGMLALDHSGRVTIANPRAEALLPGVATGREIPPDGPFSEALVPWLTDFLGATLEEGDAEFQAGERRVRVRVRRLGSHGTQGGRGVVLAMDDVTDELRAERVLAWGEMARQVAHEVKNPLTPIKLSIQHVRRAWEDKHPQFDEILLRNADAMLAEIERLASIAQSFSRFGAPGDHAAPTPVSVEKVVGEVMALYGSTPASVRFQQDVEPGMPDVVASPSELKEVIVNLLENARLAGSEGTQVSVVARRGANETVTLTVVDDGSGIDDDVLPRIFEPQFSTRSTGTGLGLAIVQRLVRAWGGNVSVRSRVGEGTAVEVVLKVWKDAAGDQAGSAEQEATS